MQKLLTRLSTKSGLVPGTVVHVGDRPTDAVRVTLINYNEKEVEERLIADVEECAGCKRPDAVTWINVEGVHQVEIIESLGRQFGLHTLLLEDIVHTSQRPKVEEFDDHTYVVLHMLYVAAGEGEADVEIDSEQVSLVVGYDYVLTFIENPGDVFDPVRDRIRVGRGRVRKLGADYLAYALMDVIVDNYFGVLEEVGEAVEELEAQVTEHPETEHLQRIREMKRAMIEMRRTVWPLREVVSVLLRGDSKRFKRTTLVFLRDLHDHVLRVVDVAETLREMIGSMLEIYLSNVSNRMNEVMKVLTVMASLFIPLTFIAGVYGMNFANMPELQWRYGYWVVWGVMLAVAIALLVYFRRRRWL
jgi:magnesium transporter